MRVPAAVMCAGLIASFAGAAAAETAAPEAGKSPAVTWDRAANIRESAERIGMIQRTRGAEGAIKHIDACYRTHGLASAYSAAFEGCIAQDYLQTKLLTRIYGRLKPEELRRIGAPTADQMAQAMGRRVVAAFRQYKVSAAEADAFKTEVDKVGLPVFLKTVFPNSAAEIDGLGEKSNETGKSKEKN
jgi:hypothetical protein